MLYRQGRADRRTPTHFLVGVTTMVIHMLCVSLRSCYDSWPPESQNPSEMRVTWAAISRNLVTHCMAVTPQVGGGSVCRRSEGHQAAGRPQGAQRQRGGRCPGLRIPHSRGAPVALLRHLAVQRAHGGGGGRAAGGDRRRSGRHGGRRWRGREPECSAAAFAAIAWVLRRKEGNTYGLLVLKMMRP